MQLPFLILGVSLFRRSRIKDSDLESRTHDLIGSSSSNAEKQAAQRRASSSEQENRGHRYVGRRRGLNDNDSNEDRVLREPSEQSATSRPASTTPLQLPQSLFSRLRNRLAAIKDFILQTDGSADGLGNEFHNHRLLPILSGIVIPFSILLEIPGLTGHWYIITENNKIVYSRKNSALLDTGLAISMACGLIANIAIIIRFLEKKVRTATLVAIVALTIHDAINISAVTIFGVIHRFNDGFTYGQSFWFTMCSTIASLVTNVTLVIDYVRTPNFARATSGLTRKQRSLVIVVMLLLMWIAIGGLFNSLLMGLNFIDGMYFTVVVIETIGFGDIVPKSVGARIFCAIHATIGILNLALAVGICNDTVIESFQATYKKHLSALDERRKATRERRQERRAEKIAIKRQLVQAGLPVHVYRVKHFAGSRVAVRRKHLNVEALSEHQTEIAMQEAQNILRLETKKRLGRKSTFASQLSFDNTITENLKKEFMVKLTCVWILFLIFWLIGAAVFSATENWSFGAAIWFCFEAFTTIGFGDQTPQTPAGRSVFIVWALLGVGTMTILVSVLSEAYSSRYRKAIQKHNTVRSIPRHEEENDEVVHGSSDESREKDMFKLHSPRRHHARQYFDAYRRHTSCPEIARGHAHRRGLLMVDREDALHDDDDSEHRQHIFVKSHRDKGIDRVSVIDFANTRPFTPSTEAWPADWTFQETRGVVGTGQL